MIKFHLFSLKKEKNYMIIDPMILDKSKGDYIFCDPKIFKSIIRKKGRVLNLPINYLESMVFDLTLSNEHLLKLIIKEKLFTLLKSPYIGNNPCVVIINNNKETDDSFSNIPCKKYFGIDLELFLIEGNVINSSEEFLKNKYSLLIEDLRFIFLISSNVLKINKLLTDNYLDNLFI